MEVKQFTTLEKCAIGLAGLPQAELPTAHLFVEGQCLREMNIPKDTIVIGKRHKKHTIDICLSGALIVVNESIDGKLSEPKLVKAPAVVVSEPGNRKIARSLSDVSWLNSFTTDCTTPEEVEDTLVYPECEVAELQQLNKEMPNQLAEEVLVMLGVQQ